MPKAFVWEGFTPHQPGAFFSGNVKLTPKTGAAGRPAREPSSDDHIVCWETAEVWREFIYGADAAEGILLATERYDDAEPVNIGAGAGIRIKDRAGKIAERTGFAGEIRSGASQPEASRDAAPTSRRPRPGLASRPRLLWRRASKRPSTGTEPRTGRKDADVSRPAFSAIFHLDA